MRISNTDAKELAISLAKSYLEVQPYKDGWHWTCIDAQPSAARARKIYSNWAVIVEWKHNECIFDGPMILLVDIQSGKVTTYD